MLYNSKSLASAFLIFFNFILIMQVNGQLPGLFPPIPDLLPPLPFLPPVIPDLQSPPVGAETCPKNTVKVKIACADVFGFSVLPIGAEFNPLRTPCCKLVEGLLDIEVAACFCRAIKLDYVSPGTSIPVKLVTLFNYCKKEAPPGFVCE